MFRYPQVVISNKKLYIGGGEASSDREKQTVVVYNPKQDSYDTLPPYTYQCFAVAVVNDQLVLVGGWDKQANSSTNKLGVWNEQSRCWTHSLPPMTTGCFSPSVTTHKNRWLVVMGGALLAIGGGYLGNCAIYVYQPSTETWMEACAEGLPTRRSQCICAVLPNGDMYVTGGDPGIVARVDIASL